MGRDKLYPEEWTLELKTNAEDLVRRVNNLLRDLGVSDVKVSSGWRPLEINRKAGGAKRSLHMWGKAVDLADPDGSLAQKISDRYELLTQYGLWLEEPSVTKGWVHLDTGVRHLRAKRIFRP